MLNRDLPSADTIHKYQLPPGTRATVPIEKTGVDAAKLNGGKLQSFWTDITPEMARRWLKNNFRNRPVKEDVVNAYARDMHRGKWRRTHQGIGFNDRDELIDGQHRLLAIVKSGKTITMMVTFGLESKTDGDELTTMDCVDRGATRSVADQLRIQHELANGAQIAQVVSGVAHLCVGERVRRLSVNQTLEIYRAFETAIDFVIARRSKTRGLRSAGVLAGFAFVYPAANFTQVNQAFAGLNSGEWPADNYPACKLLRGFLTGQQSAMLIQSLNKGVAEMTVHTLWSDLTGRKPAQLESSPEEWLKAVAHFRDLQRERVEKVAALFALPKFDAPAGAAPVPAHAPAVSAQIAAPVASPAAKARPTIERITNAVESRTKLSWFVIAGRGRDPEIDSARVVFIYVARSLGHTASVVAAALKRTEEQIRDYTLPLAAMTTKQKATIEAIGKTLGK